MYNILRYINILIISPTNSLFSLSLSLSAQIAVNRGTPPTPSPSSLSVRLIIIECRLQADRRAVVRKCQQKLLQLATSCKRSALSQQETAQYHTRGGSTPG